MPGDFLRLWAMSSPATDPEIAVVQWTPQERESFFAAIARHRRAARRVNGVARACALVMAVAIAVLMAPLYYAIIGIALDVLNLVMPMPDLLGAVTDAVDQAVERPETISVGRWVFLLAMAALPGVIVMLLAVHALDRVMREAMTSDAGNYAAREPNPGVLAEQRFANVVSEMAIAANFPQPRVLIIDAEPASAAAFGENDQHATVAVSTGLLAQLNRAEMQGVAAHLVGSIANGDMLIGVHVATTLGLFGLISRLGDSFSDRDAFRRFMKVLRAAMRRGSSVEDGQLALLLTNPFDGSDKERRNRPEKETTFDKVRTWALMPLTGPLVISGFLGSMLASMLLGPLLALMWRRRKFLADATAVQLTRDPDALAGALRKVRGAHVEGAFAPWIAHMTLVDEGAFGKKNIMSAAPGGMFPALGKRLKALAALGATVSVQDMPRTSWASGTSLGLALMLGVLGAIAAMLSIAIVPLLVFLSTALSMFFTWLPAMILHAILR